MIETFQAGGPLMYALAAAALFAIAVVFERLIVLHRMPSPAKAEKQLEEIENALSEGGIEGAAQKVAKGKGVLNYIFARLLRRYDTLVIEKRELANRRREVSGDSISAQDPVTRFLTNQQELNEFRQELLIAIEDSSKAYVTRFLSILNTVSNISPLMGLLGTITGMIGAFESIAAAGTGDPKVVAGGISQALITTATGLIIAIPAIVFYRYLGSKADTSRAAVEIYAITFSNSLLAMLERQ